jgi:hypothetical protein
MVFGLMIIQYHRLAQWEIDALLINLYGVQPDLPSPPRDWARIPLELEYLILYAPNM